MTCFNLWRDGGWAAGELGMTNDDNSISTAPFVCSRPPYVRLFQFFLISQFYLFSFAAVQCSGYTECGSSGKVLISAAATTNCTAASCTEAECCTTGHFEHKKKRASLLAISTFRMHVFFCLLSGFASSVTASLAARQQRRPRYKSPPANVDFSRSICFPSTHRLMRQHGRREGRSKLDGLAFPLACKCGIAGSDVFVCEPQ